MSHTGQDSRARSRCGRDSIPFTRQDSETRSRHNRFDEQSSYTVVVVEPSTTSRNISSLRHKVIGTRSGQAVHGPLRLMINV